MYYEQRKNKKYKSVIPMINVVFLLLIYFMVAGQLKKHEELVIEPPQTSYEKKSVDNGHVNLLVSSEGQLVLMGELIELDNLLIALDKLLDETNEVIIKADKTLPMVELLAIINRLKQSDYENIKLLII